MLVDYDALLQATLKSCKKITCSFLWDVRDADCGIRDRRLFPCGGSNVALYLASLISHLATQNGQLIFQQRLSAKRKRGLRNHQNIRRSLACILSRTHQLDDIVFQRLQVLSRRIKNVSLHNHRAVGDASDLQARPYEFMPRRIAESNGGTISR